VRLRVLAALAALACAAHPASAQRGAPADAQRFEAGRFTVLAYSGDAQLARSLLAAAQDRDTFPGLPRPVRRVTIALAPDDARFAEWVGSAFPEWGAAAAFPATHEIVMHGRRTGSASGDPLVVLRHELAHLALAEVLGDLPPRWFDEGYASFAAGEWGREEVLATNIAFALRGPTTFAALDSTFSGGASRATAAYALAHRAVAELSTLDRSRGLALFFTYWRETRSLDRAMRQAYGLTQDGFEERWRTRTRRRYGVLAIVTDVGVVAGGALIILLPMYVSRRRRQKERLETLRKREEDQARRARESALDALLSRDDPQE
jgi:peptidoglycan/xylan/chitin deacetylase (PgdA/CDA1 family)